MPNKKKFLVCNLSREWQYLGQGEDRSTRDIQHQLARWLVFIDQFERALDTGMEIHCLGDVNLDFLTWTKSDLDPAHKTVKLRPLISVLFDRILSREVKQCVTTSTRSWSGQEDSGLDHVYTKTLGKISEVQVHSCGSSYHKIINVVRFPKNIGKM